MKRKSHRSIDRSRKKLNLDLDLNLDLLVKKKKKTQQSEYPAPSDGRREWLTRFTGSAGTAVVTLSHGALLWTDGRYFLQAEKQLKSDEWTLMRSGLPGVPEPPEWLAANLRSGARVGIDPALHTVEGARKLTQALERAGCELVPLDAPPTPAASNGNAIASSSPRHPPSNNPVDLAWGACDASESPRPDPPSAPIRIHPALWAGETAADKIARMRSRMRESGAGALLVTALDEVAWLLNLRGGDVPHNPVFLSYAVVTLDSATLFTDEAKLAGGSGGNGEEAARLRAHLEAAGVGVAPYAEASAGVAAAAREACAAAGLAVWADPSKVSYALFRAASSAWAAEEKEEAPAAKRAKKEEVDSATKSQQQQRFVEKPSPVTAAKALKNDAELAGMAEAHARDSVALAQTLRWLEEEVGGAKEGASAAAVETKTKKTVRETDVDEFVTGSRARQPGFVEPSFPTIAGVDANGAVIHYRAEAGDPQCRAAGPGSLLLLDSGGQFDCGTTDVTRTVWLGASSRPASSSSSSASDSSKPPAQIVEAFTRVLQGHIALDSAVFPEGTPGLALDAFARAALWRCGLNYRHGTGHGVGAALNVHEGPQSISTRLHVHTPLDARMVVSNEPGFYEDGAFGIRIENLVTVEEAETKYRFGGQRYFKFRKLTLAPLQRALIDTRLLTPAEADWVDAYHAAVRRAVLPRLRAAGDEATASWLEAATEPLERETSSSSSSSSASPAPVGGGGGGADAGGCVVETAPEPVGVGAK